MKLPQWVASAILTICIGLLGYWASYTQGRVDTLTHTLSVETARTSVLENRATNLEVRLASIDAKLDRLLVGQGRTP